MWVLQQLLQCPNDQCQLLDLTLALYLQALSFLYQCVQACRSALQVHAIRTSHQLSSYVANCLNLDVACKLPNKLLNTLLHRLS